MRLQIGRDIGDVCFIAFEILNENAFETLFYRNLAIMSEKCLVSFLISFPNFVQET